MAHVPGIIAVVFDFDDTLLPDSTTMFLSERGISTEDFWKETRRLVSQGYDQATAYLRLMLDNVGEGKPLGPLTNKDLREFGASLDGRYYPGIPQIFEILRDTVGGYRDIDIEFYVISGGLQEIIEGSSVISDHFTAVYGAQLDGDDRTGILQYIKRCVTFTEKTRYLFEINKGLESRVTRENPYLVNKAVDVAERRIPFRNMIYVGDGLTDIPCFSLVETGGGRERVGGTPIAVFNPSDPQSAKRAFREFLSTSRVASMHAPRYREDDELGALLKAIVATKCTDIMSRRLSALQGS